MTATIPLFGRLSALADPIRCRLLLALERQQLTVTELQRVLQLPQSTVSRHLKLLADEGWLSARANGTSNWYRLAAKDLDPSARRLWQVVRDQALETPAARRDAERVRSVIAARHSQSQRFFASRAGHWDRLRAELFGSGAEWVALTGLLDPAATVVDLGCGTGELAARLAPHVRRVIAIDEAPAMLEAARRRLGGFANVGIESGSLEALPLPDRSVDLAFAVLVLHHLSDPAAAIAEVARVLVEGGRVVVLDMGPHERIEYREEMGHQWLGLEPAALAEWCASAGLEVVRSTPLPAEPTAKGPPLVVTVARK